MRLPGARSRPIVIACLMAAAGAVALAGSAPVRLVGVSALSDRAGQTVLIEATDPVAYTIKRPDPLTLLVDLRNVAVSAAAKRASQLSEGPVRAVSVEELTESDGNAIARVRMQLGAPAPHRVRSTRNTIRVEFARADADPPAGPDTSEPKAAPAMPGGAVATAAATSLRSVATGVTPGRMTVTLRGNGHLEASRVVEAADLPPRLVLDFVGVDSAAPAQTAAPGGPVTRIRVARNSQNPLVTRVVVDLDRMVPYRVERAGNGGEDLAVVFETSQPAADASGPPSPPAIDGAIGRTEPEPVPDPFSALTLVSGAVPTLAVPERPAIPPPAAAPAPARQSATPLPRTAGALTAPQTPPAPAPLTKEAQAPQRYTGQLVSMDFQDADLRAVLRTFAEISGLNMVIDPAVQGTVDVVLNEVPWDQALDIILRGSKLGYAVDGTVVRIAPLAVLAEEEAARQKLNDAQALAGELGVMTKSLSYAKAASFKDLITRSALSQRGEVQIDERTNTLIIRDLSANLVTAERLIADLDRPEPQVEIEARIVQTTRSFARALGVKWGLSGRAGAELGNTTGLGFPNRGILEGRLGEQNPIDPRRTSLDQMGTAINLPVQAANAGVGLLMSSINGAFNLDIALTALERSGKGRILSTPRVTAQNNQEAEMTQGVQIPIQTVANNTVTVSFKDAALTLKVTPQITSADTVIMRIQLENAEPDYTRSVNGIPPIDTQRANTSVQVSDGATTVIGGVFVNREQEQREGVPFLSKIPLLGWLFRRDSAEDGSRELLIFITPRILRG